MAVSVFDPMNVALPSSSPSKAVELTAHDWSRRFLTAGDIPVRAVAKGRVSFSSISRLLVNLILVPSAPATTVILF